MKPCATSTEPGAKPQSEEERPLTDVDIVTLAALQEAAERIRAWVPPSATSPDAPPAESDAPLYAYCTMCASCDKLGCSSRRATYQPPAAEGEEAEVEGEECRHNTILRYSLHNGLPHWECKQCKERFVRHITT